MNESIQKIGAVIKNDPAIDNVVVFTGGGGATNTGFVFMALKPLEERKIGAPDIINRLRPQLNRLVAASAFLQASQDLRIGGRNSSALYQYTIQSDTVTDLSTWGPKLLTEMKRLPGLQDVNTDQQNGGLDVLLKYDRVTAAKLGQTANSMDNEIYNAFGQAETSIIYTQLNQYYVVLEVDPRYSQTPEGLKNIYFHPNGSSSVTATGNVPARSTVYEPGQHHPFGSQPHQLVSLCHHLFQPGARRLPKRGHTGHRATEAAHGRAVNSPRVLRRHAAGVPAIA